jgi:hypothetical protein
MSEFRDKLLSIGFISGNPRPKEYRRDDGVRVKETVDEHGNMTRLHNTGDTERQDVEIRPQTVVQRMTS